MKFQPLLQPLLDQAGFDCDKYALDEERENVICLEQTEAGYEVCRQTGDGFLMLRTFSDPLRAVRVFLRELNREEPDEELRKQILLDFEQVLLQSQDAPKE
ncbi:hypothetical protein [Allobaculum mucilyticum]|uniref:hypothetical protein n=1 Tax=Allobaculum mucilyticum TaxID=2834459 RepID=UPI001E30ED4A|nr:hypothetical protein [Allobaculum mucilyticum]UNT96812.1 hypothetical protein KWG62_03395 [Allobaculum mucilyticum]